MRILFFSHYYPPENNAPAVRTAAHCKAWAAAGHDVTVITCAPNHPTGKLFPGYSNKLWQKETIDGVAVIRVFTFLAANKGFARRILNYISFMLAAVLASVFVRRADVVIATSPQFFCGWAGVFGRLIHRAPFVLEVRDIWPESIVAVGAITNRWIIGFLEILERLMYRSAARIVTVGRGYREQLTARGVPESKISVIYNGADLPEFSRSADEPASGVRPQGSSFVCTYVGTVGMAHGLGIVLEAAKILRERGHADVGFLIVGDGAEREKLEEQAAAAGLSQVQFTGQVPRSLIPGILAATDCCLVHLKDTALFSTVIPSKIFEMLCAKKPIIIGVRGEAEEIVVEAGAGVSITPGSAVELAEALIELKETPERLAALGRAGRKFVEQNFNRQAFAEQYLELMQELLGSKKPSAQVFEKAA